MRHAVPAPARERRPRALLLHRIAVSALALGLANTSLAAGEFVDKAASALAIFIIFAMPIGGVILFWMVHVLPEKIAHKRHHPQRAAIQTLCLLSLVFGGILWPLAWLWAYTKPVFHKMAYGTDLHEDYYKEQAAATEAASAAATEAVANGQDPTAAALRAEIAQLNRKLAELEARGNASPANVGGAG
jgi:CBS domain containing-hemolysin-like protein